MIFLFSLFYRCCFQCDYVYWSCYLLLGFAIFQYVVMMWIIVSLLLLQQLYSRLPISYSQLCIGLFDKISLSVKSCCKKGDFSIKGKTSLWERQFLIWSYFINVICPNTLIEFSCDPAALMQSLRWNLTFFSVNTCLSTSTYALSTVKP